MLPVLLALTVNLEFAVALRTFFDVEPVAEKIADLGWEVTMAPGEYLVIGAREDRPGTLGHQAFVRPDESVPVPC